jgi:hypothetical protein
MSQKIVINKCWGGFGLNSQAMRMFNELGGTETCDWDIKRDNPILVRVVEELHPWAGGDSSNLKVVEIPEGISWHIHDYDGMESVEEDHRSWG